jgi:hypothetical protein
MNRKISAVFAITVILLVGGFLAFVFSWQCNIKEATPSVVQKVIKANKEIDTSNWKLYQNKIYGYEIKYPEDWKIITLGNVEPETFSAPDFQSPECFEKIGKTCSDLMVGNIHKIEKGETIESDIPLGAGSNYRLISKKPMKVGGEDAVFVEYFQPGYGRRNGTMGVARQQIKVIHESTSYLISLDEENDGIKVLDSSKYWKNADVFDTIITSFEFLK